MTKLAIMQPYFFPYPGYFELIASVDIFMYLTDVQYSRGWINRNRIRNGSDWSYITVPLSKHKQKDIISEIKIADNWNNVANKHISTFRHVYKNIDCELLDIYRTISTYNNLCEMLKYSIERTCKYLGIKTTTDDSAFYNIPSHGENKIIDLCKIVGADHYVNLPNGVNIYNKSHFEDSGINIEFIPMTSRGTLSILDYCFNENNLLVKTRSQPKCSTEIWKVL